MKYHKKENSGLKATILILFIGCLLCTLGITFIFTNAWFQDNRTMETGLSMGDIELNENVDKTIKKSINDIILKDNQQLFNSNLTISKAENSQDFFVRVKVEVVGTESEAKTLLQKLIIISQATNVHPTSYEWTRVGDYYYLTNNGSLKAINDNTNYDFFNLENSVIDSNFIKKYQEYTQANSTPLEISIAIEARQSIYVRTVDFLSDINSIFNDTARYLPFTIGAKEGYVYAPSYVKGGEMIVAVPPQFRKIQSATNVSSISYNTFKVPAQIDNLPQNPTNQKYIDIQYANEQEKTYQIKYNNQLGDVIVKGGKSNSPTSTGLSLVLCESLNSAVLEAQPKAGFYFQHWKIGEEEIKNPILNTKDIDMSKQIEAVFTKGGAAAIKITLKVNDAQTLIGKIKVEGMATEFTSDTRAYPQSDTLKIIATGIPVNNDNKKVIAVKQWLKNGAFYSNDTSISIPLNEVATYTVEFETVSNINLNGSEMNNLNFEYGLNEKGIKSFRFTGTPSVQSTKEFYGFTTIAGINESNIFTNLESNPTKFYYSNIWYPLPTSKGLGDIHAVMLTPNVGKGQTDVNVKQTATSINNIILSHSVKTITGNENPNSNIQKILFTNTIETIGENAFRKCTGLNGIYFPEDSIIKSIEGAAFADCTALTKVKIPDSIQVLKNAIFAMCSNLKTVEFSKNSQLSLLYGQVFMATGLTEFNAPKKLNVINSKAFAACPSLTTVNFESNDMLNVIAEYAFADCKALTTINIPDSVYRIEKFAFLNTTALKSINIPAQVQSIYISTFQSSGIEQINFAKNSSLISIDEKAFANSKIKNVVFPKNLKYIGVSAFNICAQLQSIVFEDNSQLEEIGEESFNQCGAMTSINFGNNSNLKYIRARSFGGTFALDNINFGANSKLEIVEKQAFVQSGIINLKIPTSVKIIELAAFVNMPRLKTITFENNSQLQSIGQQAFALTPALTSCNLEVCKNLTNIGILAFSEAGFSSIIIPEAVRIIDIAAFKNCNKLETVKFLSNNNLHAIKDEAFALNLNIKTISVQGNSTYPIPASTKIVGGLAFFTTFDSEGHIFHWNGIHSQSKGILMIPFIEKWIDNNNNTMVYISDYVFAKYKGTNSSVTLKDTTHSIMDAAFACNTSITSVDTASEVIVSYGFAVFFECINLTHVYFRTREGLSNTLQVGTLAFSTHCRSTTFHHPSKPGNVLWLRLLFPDMFGGTTGSGFHYNISLGQGTDSIIISIPPPKQ